MVLECTGAGKGSNEMMNNDYSKPPAGILGLWDLGIGEG